MLNITSPLAAIKRPCLDFISFLLSWDIILGVKLTCYAHTHTKSSFIHSSIHLDTHYFCHFIIVTRIFVTFFGSLSLDIIVRHQMRHFMMSNLHVFALFVKDGMTLYSWRIFDLLLISLIRMMIVFFVFHSSYQWWLNTDKSFTHSPIYFSSSCISWSSSSLLP